jgi:hypothetical protein
MKFLIICFLALFSVVVHAGEQRIYQRDSVGSIMYHKPSYIVQENGRIIEMDKAGNKQYHKQQYQLKDGKIYQVDSIGNIQYHKPGFVVK